MSGQTRIINRVADTQLVSGDYVLVDSQTEGTRKFDLGTFANTTNTAISNIEGTIGSTTMGTTATTVTGAIAEHEADITALNDKIYYLTYSFTFTYDAGTIGTRGAQMSEAISSEYTSDYIIGISIVYVATSSNYIPVAFYSTGNIYCNAYRASTSAVSNGRIDVRVAFLKRS